MLDTIKHPSSVGVDSRLYARACTNQDFLCKPNMQLELKSNKVHAYTKSNSSVYKTHSNFYERARILSICLRFIAWCNRWRDRKRVIAIRTTGTQYTYKPRFDSRECEKWMSCRVFETKMHAASRRCHNRFSFFSLQLFYVFVCILCLVSC